MAALEESRAAHDKSNQAWNDLCDSKQLEINKLSAELTRLTALLEDRPKLGEIIYEGICDGDSTEEIADRIRGYLKGVAIALGLQI